MTAIEVVENTFVFAGVKFPHLFVVNGVELNLWSTVNVMTKGAEINTIAARTIIDVCASVPAFFFFFFNYYH